MKRLFILLLALCLLVSASACGAPGTESSAPAEDVSRKDESPAVSVTEDSSEEISIPECEKKAEIDALYQGEVEKDLPRANALLGRPYGVNARVSSSYPERGNLLSDGAVPESFNRYSWIGFESGSCQIDFDLGEVCEKIGAFRAVFLSQTEYAIYLPQDVTVYISEDGEKFVKLCKMSGISDPPRAQTYDFEFNLGEYVNARYVRFWFRCAAGLAFLGELEAYVYGAERDDSLDLVSVYPEYTTPHCEPEFRPDGSAEVKNLALGAEVHAMSFAKVAKKNVDGYGNVQDTSILCDGKTLKAPAWDSDLSFRMTRGDGREITFDLGYASSVGRFSAQSMYIPSWGVFPPDDICVSVSADGEEWQSVAVMSVDKALLDGSNRLIEFEADAGAVYIARFVRFTFLFNTHTAFTEFCIFGTEKALENAIMPDSSANGGKMPYEYPDPDNIGGAQNILCSYLCNTKSACGVYSEMLTAQDYLNIIGYYEEGELKDVIFENMVITPHNNFASAADRELLKGWVPYFETQFTKDRGIEAISQAAGEIAKAKGDANYKEGIFLSAIRPRAVLDGKVNTFGDIDGDGVDESFDSIENRKKVIRWEVDMQLERLSQIDAPNVKLMGFYWLSEALYYDEPDEIEIVKYAIDYVHSKGYLMFWIPYYNAAGWNTWRELGFDFACLQPNYSFSSEADEGRLRAAALKAKLYGMSVEVELNNTKSDENVRRYKEYLQSSLEYGHNETTKIYYLGGVPSDLTAARDSEYEFEKSIYKDTYMYSKRLLDKATYKTDPVIPLVAPHGENMTGKAGKRITGKINMESEYNYVLVITVQPKYGSLQVYADGRVVYMPERGFYGEDCFCVAAKDLTGGRADVRTGSTVESVP